ncbi:MAG: DNA recombination protein RmuC [Gammaproteobacteria bacterium]|nr:DNA recombination protein RmuC [Gammaproteobacteria bacterium]
MPSLQELLTMLPANVALPWVAAAFGVGMVIGVLVYFAVSLPRRRRLRAKLADLQVAVKTEAAIAAERETALAHAEERLTTKVSNLTHQSMSRHSENFLRLAQESLGKHHQQAKASMAEREQAVEQLIKPIQDALQKTHEQIGAIEKTRHEAFGNIRAQLEAMTAGQQTLRDETQRLVQALRRPEVRGQWGEITLRRIVEMAGMVEHCDFTEQVHTTTDAGAMRPDLVIHLPDRGEIVVDVKTPLDAYLQAVEAREEQSRGQALQKHARNVANRVRELSAKAYWSQFERSPEFVILFIPGEQFLSAALTENPTLLDEAIRQKVILATPTSLIALLKAVAYGWQQLSLTDNAEEIRRLAVELYGRLGTFTNHMVQLGKRLTGGVQSYNQAIGSLEKMVLPGARKFTELGIQARDEIPPTAEVEATVREAGTSTDDASDKLPKLESSSTRTAAEDSETTKPH